MTDDVIPSPGSDSNGYIVARLIEFAGGSSGWVQESANALLADNDPKLDQTAVPLNAFGESHSSSSFDVTIDTGEGFVGGAWVARDVTTTVTLASSTNNQDVYIGWDHDATESMIIGTSSAFGAQDPTLKIWTFDTDGSGVTNATDQRPIGQQNDLGVATLDDGSKFGRWISQAVGAANGTAGDQNNEMFRLPGNTSDLITAVDDGSGAVSFAYNAYFDGSWKFTVGNTRAYLLQFSSNEVRLRVSSSASTAADNAITWIDVAVDSNGDMIDNAGNVFYDLANNQVPQARLGGAASSLGTYPIPDADIDSGSGSGLDADLVDGKHASEISGSGEWTVIDTNRSSDGTTLMETDTGTLTTTYDEYEVDLVLESANDLGDSTFNEYRVQLQNDASTNYETLIVDQDQNVTSNTNTYWQDIAKHQPQDGAIGVATIRLATRTTVNPQDQRFPRMSVVSNGGTWHFDHAVSGTLKVDVSRIDRIRVVSKENASGVIRIKGRTF